jgi:hypothetical protein
LGKVFQATPPPYLLIRNWFSTPNKFWGKT